MTTYYLMVTTYTGNATKTKHAAMPDQSSPMANIGVIRRFVGGGKKLQNATCEYERILNGGVNYSPELAVRLKVGEVLNSVLALPYAQARDFVRFPKFEDAPFFRGGISE